ncbi:MAG TPA: arginine--tRNA ligase [Thermoleophilaceae bacterium]|nr:arginine--tRNA ligase [Thermoleophilaceae bacterium]
MPTPHDLIADACARALADLAPDHALDVAATVQPSRNPEHGDYQCNAALRLAKQLGRKPLEIAEELAAALPESDVFAPPEVAPPGFVNFRLKDAWLATALGERAQAGDVRLGPAPAREHVVVDFSSPNVAKEMHVGHLRSTIIGDALSRFFEAYDHEVDRVSHVGDWGTQFGMLITHLREAGTEEAEVQDLNSFYREAKRRFDDDEAFKDRSRQAVVELQQGDPEAREHWQALCERSRHEFQEIYERLGIVVSEKGESFYEPYLAETVKELEDKGLVVVDGGAKCVYVEGFTNKDGEPLPLIIEKADGGYNYATTDLAAIRYRIQQGADRILYVIDLGQSQHMEMVFAVARKAGWLTDQVDAVHVGFGLVLGEDQKRLRTREGESIPLKDLLDEAVRRARELAAERLETARGTRKAADIDAVGEHMGIAAVKYAELSHNRTTNYVFAFDKMVSLHGNTAPYILYAYARVAGIAAEAARHQGGDTGEVGVAVATPNERQLALDLARFEETVSRAMADYQPSVICDYLFGVCQQFSRFYEESRVIGEDGSVDVARLRLCEATAATIKAGLGLLGIETLEEI